jgi:hypothetical protein
LLRRHTRRGHRSGPVHRRDGTPGPSACMAMRSRGI